MTGPRAAARRWSKVTAAVLLPAAVLGLVVDRIAGESQRTHDVVQSAVAELERSIQADCDWYRDLGTAPVPATNTLGRRLVLDARNAYDARCTSRYGPLPPPVPATPTPSTGR